MILHHEELARARAYDEDREFEALSEAQMGDMLSRGRALFQWFKANPRLHNGIKATVFIALFVMDYLVRLSADRAAPVREDTPHDAPAQAVPDCPGHRVPAALVAAHPPGRGKVVKDGTGDGGGP